MRLILSFFLLSFIGAAVSQTINAKRVILSAMTVTDLHSISGSTTFTFECFNPGNEASPLATQSINSITQTDFWTILELELFIWDSTDASQIQCSVTSGGTVTSTSLGTTQTISYNQITYEGYRADTTNPAEASFYLRCGNCYPYANYVAGAAVEKTVALKAMQVSDTLDTFASPSFYITCQLANDAKVYTLNVDNIGDSNVEYTENLKFSDFTWNNGTMGNSATCGSYRGIYEEDTGDDDCLGITIIHFDDITVDGGKFTLFGDANSWITLFDCQSPDACSPASILQISALFLIFIALL